MTFSFRTNLFFSIGLATLAFVHSFYESKNVVTGLLNDEAVEILQTVDLPSDHFYFFAPSHKSGHVDVIESFVPYLMQPFVRLFGSDKIVFQTVFALFFAFTATLIFLILQILVKKEYAILGSLLFIFSAYSTFFNHIVTRNGISYFWSALLILLSLPFLNGKDRKPDGWQYLVFGLISCIALLSYSSIKFFLGSLFISFCIFAIRNKNKKLLLRVLGTAFLIGGGLWILLRIGQVPIQFYFQRGAYVIHASREWKSSNLWSYVGQSWLLPILLLEKFRNGGFFVDETHHIFGRSMLGWGALPFFCLGIFSSAKSFKSEDQTWAWILMVWIFGAAILSAGGPSLKTELVLFPLVIMLIIKGVSFLDEILASKGWETAGYKVAFGFMILFITEESFYLHNTIGRNRMNPPPSHRSEILIEETIHLGTRFDRVYLTLGNFADVARLRFRPYSNLFFVLPVSWRVEPWDYTAVINEASSVAFVSDDTTGVQFYPFIGPASKCAMERTLFDGTKKIGIVIEVNQKCKTGRK